VQTLIIELFPKTEVLENPQFIKFMKKFNKFPLFLKNPVENLAVNTKHNRNVPAFCGYATEEWHQLHRTQVMG